MNEVDKADGAAMAAFLDPGFDYSTDEVSVEEAQRYLAWCSRVHGEGNLELVPFAEFYIECDPAGLKYLRRHTATIGLPIGAAVLMWAHTYCVLGSAKGTLYEVIAARELGATRADVVDVLRCAGLVCGPFALNAAGELTLPYLRTWQQAATDRSSLSWPTGWKSDPTALYAGIDHASDELAPGELDRIKNWYEQTCGEFPPELQAAAETSPSAFKLARVRFERIAHSGLPAQLFPLLMLHTSVVRNRPREVRRAAQVALRLGVDRPTISKVVHWGCVLGGEWALESSLQPVLDLLDAGVATGKAV